MTCHETMVWIAKTFGLFYLITLSAVVLCYAFWPRKKKEFDAAAVKILTSEDRPWR